VVVSDAGPEERREAAVLVAVFADDGGERRLVLVRRGARGVHGGQLALPGGNREPGDRSMVDTALREAQEEVGLDPASVDVVAELDPVETRTTGFRVWPVLARVAPPAEWVAQEGEVAEVVTVPVRELADPANRGEREMTFPTWPEPRTTPFLRVGEHELWGLTYRILVPLLDRLGSL
jgi:8-oxo-dGTP pyrophosphatase MutT (NUDIX family)